MGPESPLPSSYVSPHLPASSSVSPTGKPHEHRSQGGWAPQHDTFPMYICIGWLTDGASCPVRGHTLGQTDRPGPKAQASGSLFSLAQTALLMTRESPGQTSPQGVTISGDLLERGQGPVRLLSPFRQPPFIQAWEPTSYPSLLNLSLRHKSLGEGGTPLLGALQVSSPAVS